MGPEQIREALDLMIGDARWKLLIDGAIRQAISWATPTRADILAAIERGCATGIERAMGAHPLRGRRVLVRGGEVGTVESVNAHMVACVRFDDGTAYNDSTELLTVLEE
jgi:hypothetical protein